MAFSAFGDPVFGMNDAQVAPRTSVGVYGTGVDVMSVQMMSAGVRVISAELTGDDRLTAVASRTIAGTFTVRFGGAAAEVLAVIFGVDLTADGTTPNRTSVLTIPGGQRLPGFGIIGLGLAEEGNGDQLIFVPHAKVTSDITLGSMEYGAFQTVEFTAMAVDDGDYGIVNLIKRETTGAYAWPPAGIVPA